MPPRFSPTDTPAQIARKLNEMAAEGGPGSGLLRQRVAVIEQSLGNITVGGTTGPGLDRIGNELRLNIAELPIAPEN